MEQQISTSIANVEAELALLTENDNQIAKQRMTAMNAESAKLMASQTTVAANPTNKSKNRYKDILGKVHMLRLISPCPSTELIQFTCPNRVYYAAFDSSLVTLSKSASNESGYINANFLAGSLKDQEYIATQGPTNATTNDFWQMIWEQNSSLIAMLTTEKEGQKVQKHLSTQSTFLWSCSYDTRLYVLWSGDPETQTQQ